MVLFACDKALQSLGCSHVLETYLQGLAVSGFASVDSVREIQYEAACKNGKWDLELATRYYLLSVLFICYVFVVNTFAFMYVVCILLLVFVFFQSTSFGSRGIK